MVAGSSAAPPAGQAELRALQTSRPGRVVALSSSEFPSPLRAFSARLAALTPNERALASALAACTSTILVFQAYRRWWRRIRTAEHVLPHMLGGRRWVKGVVTSVGDADNFRLYHTPGPFWRWLPLRRVPTETKALRNETIHIRIAGVDAPEAAHFGRPAQPLSAEALHYLKDTVEGKRVRCLLYSKDQYGRIVALPMVRRPWLPFLPAKPLPLMMLRDGWAAVYKSGGAEYGQLGLAAYEAAEEEAKRKKRGIWSLGKKLEKPDAYKKRMASLEASGASTAASKSTARAGPKGSILTMAQKEGWWAALKKLMTE